MPSAAEAIRKKGSFYYYHEKRGRGGGGLGVRRFFEIGTMVLQNMFSALSFLQWRQDDDFADRMSYFYSSSFLIMMAVLVSFKQFGGRPLECWVPPEFTHSWEAYTEMYCWAQNTYFVPFTADIPSELKEREALRISYYQWVPFFLLIEALMFYMPCLIWRLMNDKSGIRIHDIVNSATEKENIEPEFRARTIDSLTKHVEACLRFQHALRNRNQYMHRVLKCLNLRYYEYYVTGLYLFCKVIYVCNIVGNLMLLNKFLETDDYSIYGFGVLKDLLSNKGWKDSGNFPRVTLCDFEVRIMGNLQRHTVQCVLVINIFNEKIFILLWLWFSFLFVVTLLDSLYWFSISVREEDRLRFVLRHLETTTEPRKFRKRKMRETVKRFLSTYVKVDGVFILRMLAVHAGVMFCTELTEALWKRFLERSKQGYGEHGLRTTEEEDEDSGSDDSVFRESMTGKIGVAASRIRNSLSSPAVVKFLGRSDPKSRPITAPPSSSKKVAILQGTSAQLPTSELVVVAGGSAPHRDNTFSIESVGKRDTLSHLPGPQTQL